MTLRSLRTRIDLRMAEVIGTILFVVLAIYGLFTLQQHSAQSELNSRDHTIATVQAEVQRFAVAYAELRDQDFTLGIVPTGPTAAQIANPGLKSPGVPFPTSFTLCITAVGLTNCTGKPGSGSTVTCTDHTGSGNFVCTFPKPASSSSTTSTTTGGTK